MQEIAPMCLLNTTHLIDYGCDPGNSGSVLIDSPNRQDEMRSWRGGTARLITGEPRFLVHLDTNYDRLLSIKARIMSS